MKEAYKQSEFGLVPVDWQVCEITYVTSYVDYRGKTPSKSDSGVFLITAKNIKNGKVDYEISKEYIDTNIYESVMSRGKPQIGDVLITTEAPLGEVACIENPFVALAQRIIKYRGKKNVLDNYYLKYALLSSYFQEELLKNSTGSTVKGIKGSVLHKMKILIPNFSEQQKIAEILSTVDEKIEVIEEQIAQTTQLKKGLMQQLLTKGIGHTKFKPSPLGDIPERWDCIRLKNVIKEIKGGGTPSRDNKDFWNGNIPWATVKDLKGTFLNEVEEHITDQGLKESAANLIPQNTLIIATRMALGKAVFFSKPVAINQDLKAIFPKESIQSEFLLYWFLYNSEELMKLGSGSTVKGIRLEVLHGLWIALPSLYEQEKISLVLANTDDKLKILGEKKTVYQDLKKGLMQQLLTGRLRVKIAEETFAV